MTSIQSTHLVPAESAPSDLVKIDQADLSNTSGLLHQKLVRAAKMGFFFLEIPKEIESEMLSAETYASRFHLDPSLKSMQLEGVSGYFDRKQFQVESLYLERRYWTSLLPKEINQLLVRLHLLALKILKETLFALGIKEKEHSLLTGEVIEGGGEIHFTCNHYRSAKDCIGLKGHRDFGQITLLFVNQEGLERKNRQKMDEGPSLSRIFVINFGRALETTINESNNLVAAWHRVEKLAKDRISFGLFVDNAPNSKIHILKDNEAVSSGKTFSEYLKENFKEQYEGESKIDD